MSVETFLSIFNIICSSKKQTTTLNVQCSHRLHGPVIMVSIVNYNIYKIVIQRRGVTESS